MFADPQPLSEEENLPAPVLVIDQEISLEEWIAAGQSCCGVETVEC